MRNLGKRGRLTRIHSKHTRRTFPLERTPSFHVYKDPFLGYKIWHLFPRRLLSPDFQVEYNPPIIASVLLTKPCLLQRRLPSSGFQVEVVVLDPATQAARAESNAAATTSEPDAPEPLAPRRLDGPTGFGTLTGSTKGGTGEGTSAEAGKGSEKGARLKTTKEREEDEVFGESEEEPRWVG